MSTPTTGAPATAPHHGDAAVDTKHSAPTLSVSETTSGSPAHAHAHAPQKKVEALTSVGEMLLSWATANVKHKMYIVVNNDLGMGKGKLCGQVGHAVSAWVRRLERAPTEEYHSWVSHLEPKIVLKASEATLKQLRAKYPSITEEIRDAGKTQIPAGSLTVVAFAPLHIDHQPPEIASLKLL